MLQLKHLSLPRWCDTVECVDVQPILGPAGGLWLCTVSPSVLVYPSSTLTAMDTLLYHAHSYARHTLVSGVRDPNLSWGLDD